MSHCHDHAVSSVCQTLDELDFERGIWSAAQDGDMVRLEKLLRRGDHPDTTDAAGYTALHYAARAGNVQVCQRLLDAGASVDAVTRAGCATPLHRAAYAGQKTIVELLVRAGANVKKQDGDGKTALHRAVEQNHEEIAQALLRLCTELKDVQDNKGKLAVDYARTDVLTKLLG